MRVDETLRRTVVFLGTHSLGTGFIPLGTAFMFSVDTDGIRFDYIVTARHCIEGRKKIHLRVNLKAGGVQVIEPDEESWSFHPDQKWYIDVAVMPVAASGLPPGAGAGIDVAVLDSNLVATDEIIAKLNVAAGEPIVTIGMFTSHFGQEHNIPVVRIGNIATMRSREDLVWTSKGFMDAYLVEVRSLGGLSGSPVILQIPPARIVEGSVVHSSKLGIKPYYLLGIMHGHFKVRDPNDVVETGPIEGADSVGSGLPADELNAGIGVVVPFDKVMETLNQPRLVESRKELLRLRH